MSKLLTAAPIIIVIIIGLATLIVTNSALHSTDVSNTQVTGVQQPSQTGQNTGQTPQQTGATLTMDTVALHNSASDCWIVVQGSAYDVTNFIPIHPGGPQRIIRDCGTDATQDFTTKGGRGSHSSYAYQLLNSYYVGTIGQSLTASPSNQSQNVTAQQVTGGSRFGDD